MLMFRTHAVRSCKDRRTNDLSGGLFMVAFWFLFEKILTGSEVGFDLA